MKFKSLFRRGPSQGKQEPALKGAPSVSSLDSKHHKVAPTRDKSLKIFGSKEKLHKAHKKKELGNNNAVLEDQEGEFEDAQGQFGSAEELSVRGSQECVSLPVMLNADHHMPGFQEVELRPRLPSEVRNIHGKNSQLSIFKYSMCYREHPTAMPHGDGGKVKKHIILNSKTIKTAFIDF